MKKYILSIDQGTTGSTAILVDSESLEVISKANKEFAQIFPRDGWVEHNLNDIYDSVVFVINDVIKNAGITSDQIASIGITNQRETTCAYSKSTGKPLHNAIVWQDRRTINFCNENQDLYIEKKLKLKTGLPLDPYFSGTKMKWLLENSEEVKKAANENDLCLSTIDSYLLFKLTGHHSFYTEPSNASRTLLLDINNAAWSEELLSFFKVEKSYLPEIKNTFDNFGKTKGLSFLPDNITINCLIGDQQGALVGQTGFNQGDMKCTYGTGAFILINTGTKPIFNDSGILTTIAYKDSKHTYYALEGSSYIAGAAVQWLRDNLGFFDSSEKIQELAQRIKDTSKIEQLFFFPFFSGIASPHWKSDARGAILGLTRDTGKSEISRVCLEGIAMSVADSISTMMDLAKLQSIKEIYVDGGACMNDLLMQIQADVLKLNVIRPDVIETTGYGSAIGCKFILSNTNYDSLKNLKSIDKEFKTSNNEYIQNKYSLWNKKVKALFL